MVSSKPWSRTFWRPLLESLPNTTPLLVRPVLRSCYLKRLTVIQALPIGGIPALILQDLQKLDVATASFADALIAKSPVSLLVENHGRILMFIVLQESLLTQANAIKSNIAAAFDDAIAAYS